MIAQRELILLEIAMAAALLAIAFDLHGMLLRWLRRESRLLSLAAGLLLRMAGRAFHRMLRSWIQFLKACLQMGKIAGEWLLHLLRKAYRAYSVLARLVWKAGLALLRWLWKKCFALA